MIVGFVVVIIQLVLTVQVYQMVMHMRTVVVYVTVILKMMAMMILDVAVLRLVHLVVTMPVVQH